VKNDKAPENRDNTSPGVTLEKLKIETTNNRSGDNLKASIQQLATLVKEHPLTKIANSPVRETRNPPFKVNEAPNKI
jgi:hypothetical protein